MTRDDQAIPYEGLPEGDSNRMCGAAALGMVYRSLAGTRAGGGAAEPGEVTQAEIWTHIARPTPAGGLNCATHLMVKDALRRGFAAVAVQATDPLQMLLACRANGIRAILNHRARPDSPAGHFTVLVGMDEEGVTVHDPSAGPSRRIPYGQLLELWQPRFPSSEIIGNLLIGIADQPPRLETCSACSVPIPAEAPCPQCKGPVPLAPSALVACVGQGCIRRSWARVCCPSCDLTFPFVGKAPDQPSAGPQELWDLGPLFVELDRFQTYIRSLPEVADRDDVKEQLALMDRKKEELRLARHEELARWSESDAKLAARTEAARREEDAIRKAQEAATTPAAPLDGDSLAAQLMRNLGLVK